MCKPLKVGLCITGSFCTHADILKEIPHLIANNIDITPIISYNVASTDTRFGTAKCFIEQITLLTNKPPIKTITEAEPLGPNNSLDILVIAPCTGNTLAKLNNGITDSPVLMAAKAHLRNNKPIVIGLSTNDGLGNSLRNISELLNKKNIFFVPFYQDNITLKPNSLISNTSLILPTIKEALNNKQIQPILNISK